MEFWLPLPASSIPIIMTSVMADADCSRRTRPASRTIVITLLGIVVVIGLANVPATAHSPLCPPSSTRRENRRCALVMGGTSITFDDDTAAENWISRTLHTLQAFIISPGLRGRNQRFQVGGLCGAVAYAGFYHRGGSARPEGPKADVGFWGKGQRTPPHQLGVRGAL